jgi:hypothetical protein
MQYLDSFVSSHPISTEVNNPDEISEIFDGITYGKGGSVIRMMHYFLGESEEVPASNNKSNTTRGGRSYYYNAAVDDTASSTSSITSQKTISKDERSLMQMIATLQTEIQELKKGQLENDNQQSFDKQSQVFTILGEDDDLLFPPRHTKVPSQQFRGDKESFAAISYSSYLRFVERSKRKRATAAQHEAMEDEDIRRYRLRMERLQADRDDDNKVHAYYQSLQQRY